MAKVLRVVAALAYPVVVYVVDSAAHARELAAGWLLLLLLLAAPSLTRTGEGARLRDVARPLAPVFALMLAVVASGSQRLLLLQPVLVNASLALAFGATLRPGVTPMIERFARMQRPDLPAHHLPYIRGVTRLWVGVFVAQAGVAAALAWRGDVTLWAGYTAAGGYLFAGAVFAVEWLFRTWHFRGDR